MKNSRYYPLALEALAELMPEIQETESQALVRVPSVDEVMGELGSVPDGTLFLGMADDGLPVLLNLYDPLPGSILVSGDKGSGKTHLLKCVAEVTLRMFDPKEVQFGVLTTSPSEWKDLERFEHCAAILPIYETSAMDFVFSLNAWAHQNKSRQSVILLIDGLDKVNAWNDTAINNLRWLTMRGPARRVWPVATLNSEHLRSSEKLTSEFHTFIFGATKDKRIPYQVAQSPTAELGDLIPGNQFAMKEGNDWLKFWIPRLEE
jgi:hypothetical protein